jgi:O-methyltransferase
MRIIRKLQNNFVEKRLTKVIQPHTLVDPERIHSLYTLAQRIEEERIPGDVLECGVYNGGTAAILARVATRSKLGRTVWLFDSFQGMPPTTEVDGLEAQEWVGKVLGSRDRVQDLLRRAGADLRRVRIVEGLFQDTFPAVQIPQIALLNIDADWYESVKLCLEKFYDFIVKGGFVSIDDYGHWPGCREAVDQFFRQRGLSYPLHKVDYSARWFQKHDR